MKAHLTLLHEIHLDLNKSENLYVGAEGRPLQKTIVSPRLKGIQTIHRMGHIYIELVFYSLLRWGEQVDLLRLCEVFG